MKVELIREPGWKMVSRIKGGEVAVEEYISSIFDWIEKKDTAINAYIKLMKKQALQRARSIDKKIKKGVSVGRLCGLGVAIKDNICIKGVEATCSSAALLSYVPPLTATAVQRIERDDGIILGKTNMDEFALDGCSYFGPTHNPWDSTRYPGGSSGGSAAAVSAFMATLSLGSDTAGSIRNPASFCSLHGLKPTYGLVSRRGLIPLAETFDQIGPLTRDARDCALLLSSIAGPDPKDATTIRKGSEDYLKYLVEDVKDVKIAVPKGFFEGVQKPVERTVWRAIQKLEELGATYEEISMKLLRYARLTFNAISSVESFPNLSPYANRKIGDDVKKQIIAGYIFTHKERRFYEQATRVRTLLREEFADVFKSFDALIGPTMATLPFDLDEWKQGAIYPKDGNRAPANLTGMPAMSIPCGFYQGLPVGLQLMAPHLGEGLLFRIAYSYQQSTTHLEQMPPI